MTSEFVFSKQSLHVAIKREAQSAASAPPCIRTTVNCWIYHSHRYNCDLPRSPIYKSGKGSLVNAILESRSATNKAARAQVGGSSTLQVPGSGRQRGSTAMAEPSAHICPECGRKYQTSESLNRHRKNHSETSGLACHICGASFKRSDILNRHLRTHASQASASEPSRARQACLRCASSKSKCDNGQPCTRCARGGHACIYPEQRSRARTEFLSSESGIASATITAAAAAPGGLASGPDFDPAMEWTQDPEWDSSWVSEADVQSMLWPSSRGEVMLWSQTDTSLPSYPSAGPEMLSDMAPPMPMQQSNPFLTSDTLTEDQVAGELMALATDLSPTSSQGDRSLLWATMAHKIARGYGLAGLAPAGMHVFNFFLNQFFKVYYPICPLLLELDFAPQDLPNHLYLTAIAIGAGYTGEGAAHFHRRLLAVLRVTLIRITFEREINEEALVPLCQSLVYIQSAILHFGHTQAFGFLPQLAALTATLARKVGLFSEPILETQQPTTSLRYGKQRATSRQFEVRRQLAFTIVKLDAFVSLVSDVRPSVFYDEINLRPPISSGEWLKCAPGQVPSMNNVFVDHSPHPYRNLVSIGLDDDEEYPDDVTSSELEAVVYGFQPAVWQSSYARHSALRPPFDLSLQELDLGAGAASPSERSDLPFRGSDNSWMRHLHVGHDRLVSGVKKWQVALRESMRSEEGSKNRDSLLSARLLCNISLMKLASDLPSMHMVALHCIRGADPPAEGLGAVWKWANSKVAPIAVDYACSTWSLVATELSQTEKTEVHFNILSQVALFNAAVIIWTYAGTQAVSSRNLLGSLFRSAAAGDGRLMICRGNNGSLMESFADLVKGVTPQWTPGTSKYHATVSALIQHPLPLTA